VLMEEMSFQLFLEYYQAFRIELGRSCNWWPVQRDKQRCDVGSIGFIIDLLLCSESFQEV